MMMVSMMAGGKMIRRAAPGRLSVQMVAGGAGIGMMDSEMGMGSLRSLIMARCIRPSGIMGNW